MAKKVSEYVQERVEADIEALAAEEVVDAIDGPAIELDIALLVSSLNTIVAAFKDIKGLFNPADSRGDAFVNHIALLENQIEGLIAAVLPAVGETVPED